MIILKQHKKLTAKRLFQAVKKSYQQQFHLHWLAPLGFDNSAELAVTRSLAKKYHLTTLSDLARLSPQLTIGAPQEFLLRQDALPGLKRYYPLHFKKIVALQPDLMYSAIRNHEVDVIEAFTTDPRIQQYQLTLLQDNKHFYPSYQAAIVLREAIIKQHPSLVSILSKLSGKLSNQTMRHLNSQVTLEHHSPRWVAQQFLTQQGLI